MRKLWILATAFVATAGVARANTYNFIYTGPGILASGRIVTSNSPDPSFPGGYDILSITGERNGAPIAGMVPPSGVVSNLGGLYYNNVFYPAEPHLDYNGLLYEMAGGVFDVWYDDGSVRGQTGYFELTPALVGTLGTPIRFTATAAPQPSFGAIPFLGFAALVGWRLRRRAAA